MGKSSMEGGAGIGGSGGEGVRGVGGECEGCRECGGLCRPLPGLGRLRKIPLVSLAARLWASLPGLGFGWAVGNRRHVWERRLACWRTRKSPSPPVSMEGGTGLGESRWRAAQFGQPVTILMCWDWPVFRMPPTGRKSCFLTV